MQQMDPHIGLGLAHSKQAPLDFLGWRLFEIDEDEEQFILHRREGAIAIGDIAASNSLIAFNGLLIKVLVEARCETGNEFRKLQRSQTSKCQNSPFVVGDVVVSKHCSSAV